MNRQIALWESERLTMEHAIELTVESLHTYGAHYRHWAIAYSGGKDSTATTALVAHLITTGQIPAPESLTVLYADTRMELPPLHACATTILGELEERGIKTQVVLPELNDRFFVYLFGRGVPAPKNRFKLCGISSPVGKSEMVMPSKATPIKKRIEIMSDVSWERYPILAAFPLARTWLQIQANLCAESTTEAYGRALEDFFAFCARCGIAPETATREHLANYVHDLTTRPNKRNTRAHLTGKLANATLQQRLTAVRLFYDYLMEEQLRGDNPVGRGRDTMPSCVY